MSKLHLRNKDFLISTFDFPTLYRNIPYNKLKPEIRELINFSFMMINNLLGLLYIVLVGLAVKKNIDY